MLTEGTTTRSRVQPSRDHATPARDLSRFIWIVGGIALVGSVALTVAVRRAQHERLRTQSMPYAVTGVEIADEAGQRHAFGTDSAIRMVVVLSASCPHCHRLLAALDTVFGPAHLSGVAFVFLEDGTGGRRLLDSLGLSGEVFHLVGDRALWLRRMRVVATPTTIAISADGIVEGRLLGEMDRSEIHHWFFRLDSTSRVSSEPSPIR